MTCTARRPHADGSAPTRPAAARGRRTRRAPAGGCGRRPVRLAVACAVACLTGALLVPAGATAGGSPPEVPFRLTGDRCTAPSGIPADTPGWQYDRLDTGTLHSYGTGSGVTVAIVDTGLDPAATVFGGRLAGTAGGDCVGHGTFLAGLAAAGAAVPGIAPGATILPVRDTDRRGAAGVAAVAAGVRTAVAGGASVIVVGTVPDTGRDTGAGPLRAAVREATRHGALVVAPVVADGTVPGADRPVANPLAAVPDVLTVAGATRTGAALTPNDPADLLAPGAAVTGVGPGGGAVTGTGASAAAALVGGAAAVLRGREPDLRPGQVAARLTGNAWQSDGGPALDPVAAVTAVGGRTGTPAAAPRPRPPAPTDRFAAARLAVPVGAGALGAILLLAAGAAVTRAHRRRT